MVDSIKRVLVSFIVHLLPDTRCFGLKRSLYRFAGLIIGENVRICSSARILGNGKLIIGNNTWIGHESLIICSSSITIGSNVDIAPRVFMGTGTHEIDLTTPGIAGQGINKNISIGDGCWLGAGSIILPGITLGEKTLVGAGAVVTMSYDSYKMIGGIPAKIIKDLSKCK